ncbi:MAG: glycosyltransferase family 2 protein [Amphiplicatus sp.]
MLPLAVVIVNYRTPALALRAARSALDELAAIGGRLVLVDNRSGDNSAAIFAGFKESDPRGGLVDIVLSERNGGFAAGNNLGFKTVAAAHYLLLNSDAAAEPGALTAMLKAAEAPRTGLVTPCILGPDGAPHSSRFRRHTPLSEFVDGAETGPVTRLFPHADIPIRPDDWTTRPDWVSFAAVLVTAEAIGAAGPMDEAYFLYFEDCDYCRRIGRAGYAIRFAPEARFRHDEGGSTGLKDKERRGARLPAYYYRARNRYFRRHFGPLGPVAANLAWLGGRLLARLRGLVGRPAPISPRRAGDLWNGWRG